MSGERPDNRMQCLLCAAVFDSSESLGSYEQLCQDCWEELCDQEWWEEFDRGRKEITSNERVDDDE